MSGFNYIWLSHFFAYDPETGSLTWDSPRSFTMRRGTVAGTITTNKKRVICLHRRLYPAEVIAWALGHRKWPVYGVVPKNGDYLDLRLSNLVLSPTAPSPERLFRR